MSQTLDALLRLRDLILGGALEPGERLFELAVVERLGVSRTPVRAALSKLEDEGLLEALPGGGYAVRAFTRRDVDDAIEVRGVLEGAAARLAAERGASGEQIAAARALLSRIDAIVAAPALSEAQFQDYMELNEAFHAALVAMAASPTLAKQLARSYALPFAAPSGFVMAQARLPEARTILVFAQEHHHSVLDAVEAREGARAEALMREHARLARRNLHMALSEADGLRAIRGASLIRPDAA
jgi:GntR family transcriptional regulator of vanillate catabolism